MSRNLQSHKYIHKLINQGFYRKGLHFSDTIQYLLNRSFETMDINTKDMKIWIQTVGNETKTKLMKFKLIFVEVRADTNGNGYHGSCLTNDGQKDERLDPRTSVKINQVTSVNIGLLDCSWKHIVKCIDVCNT